MKTKINIVVPMAGEGSRFAKVGYQKPKPFIDVNGIPMIELVLRHLSLSDTYEVQYILLIRKEHLEKEKNTVEDLKKKYNIKTIEISKLTEGAACTVLFAREYINNDEIFIISNSDQIIDFDFEQYVAENLKDESSDGNILTFTETEKNPKWSFAKIDSNNFVTEVAEKKVISEFATVGIYLFKKGKYFVDGAVDMIINNDRFSNEFYVCPVYNYVIKNEKKIKIFNVKEEQMHGLGTPEDLEKYLKFTNK